MSILIIGSKGMLGQDLAKSLSDQDLILWDKEDLDITDFNQVQEKIRALQPEIIINAAAYNSVDQAEIDFELARKVNADAPGYLATLAQDIGAFLIHYSTDYVFNGEKREGYLEEDLPDPISAYGFSKRLGEKNVMVNCDKYYLIRTSRLFGRPAISEGAKKSFVDTMLFLAKDRDELQIVNEEWSTPTYASDLARQTKFLLEKQYPAGIYHCSNEGSCTWYDFAREIFKQADKNIKIKPVSSEVFSRPAKRPAHSVLLNTKLSPMRPWQEALGDYLRERVD